MSIKLFIVLLILSGEKIVHRRFILSSTTIFSDRWVKRNEEELVLPGLALTPNQLFWVSAANTWCSKYRPKSLEMRIRTGAHSPGNFRVKGPFSNSEEFSQDFNCPIGSAMNPVNKCEVW